MCSTANKSQKLRTIFYRIICIFPNLCNFQRQLKLNQTMNHLNPQQLLEALKWRYATKVFDATRKIPDDVWQSLKQALVLTPTSYGLQPYKFLVIESPAKRAELLPHSWGQK